MAEAPAIGIDLGTTNSCVGYYDKDTDKIEIIKNNFSSTTTPSVVAFTDASMFVGESARKQSVRNPENTIFGKTQIYYNYYYVCLPFISTYWPAKSDPLENLNNYDSFYLKKLKLHISKFKYAER